MKIKNLINEAIQKAIQHHASDLFFLPRAGQYEFLVRTMTSLKLAQKFAEEEANEIMSYLKYQAQMDITEHRRPQVGSWIFEFEGQKYYLRLSSVGTFGNQESMVIRVIFPLNQSAYFNEPAIGHIFSLAKKRGLILTSGPTGSGKTTTMYEVAKKVGQEKVVMTIEDPVEIKEDCFLQTQVNLSAGISYEKLLKASLRQRPDILIIGEIRDADTAKLAVNAALSGHLVLATVHAKSPLQTISRLRGLGVTTNELANCLTAVTYQRLIPGKNGIKALLDIASGPILKENIALKVPGDFVHWPDELASLKIKGEISESVYEDFKNG